MTRGRRLNRLPRPTLARWRRRAPQFQEPFPKPQPRVAVVKAAEVVAVAAAVAPTSSTRLPNVPPFRFYWNAPFEISPHNPAKIYMAAQYFFKSNNRGDSWWMNSTDLTKNVDRWAAERAHYGRCGR